MEVNGFRREEGEERKRMSFFFWLVNCDFDSKFRVGTGSGRVNVFGWIKPWLGR